MDHNDYLRALAAEEAYHRQVGKEDRAKAVAAERRAAVKRFEAEGLTIATDDPKPETKK